MASGTNWYATARSGRTGQAATFSINRHVYYHKSCSSGCLGCGFRTCHSLSGPNLTLFRSRTLCSPIRIARLIHRNLLFIDADLVFDESFGAVHDALSTVFGVPNPTLHIQGSLGTLQSFNDPLRLTGFSLIGTFSDVVLKPCSELTLSAIGVELFGYEGVRYTKKATAFGGMCYGFRIFGSMHVGLDQTLDLSFDLGDVGGELFLKATQLDVWNNAFGVKGLSIDGLSFGTTLNPSLPMKTFSFNVSAGLSIGGISVDLIGYYNADKSFSMSASLTNFGTKGLSDLYSQLYGRPVSLPQLNVDIGNATLTIASGRIFNLVVHDISVEHYFGVNAEVQFSSAGIVLKANMTDNGSGEKTLKLSEIEIKKVYIQVSFRAGPNSSSSVILGGELRWESFTLDAGVHIYRPAILSASQPQASSLQWTVFADFVTDHNAKKGMALSSLVPELEDTFLGDVALEDAALIIASQDDPEFGSFNTTQFPVKQGIQVCAVLGMIKAISDLMRLNQPPRLILAAGWSKATGFSLDVVLPAPLSLDLGRGIVTDPFSLQIRASTSTPSILPPTIQLNAGVKIPTPNDPRPLHFTLSLAFNAVEGYATGELAGYWTNPFGLSPKVRIGPEVALTMGILIEELIVSPFGFVGGLKVGDVMVNMALEISEIPSQEVLYAEVDNLHITDVVSLARDLTQLPIPMVPDFMVFRHIKFYLCPMGTTIGNIVYQRGCQFSADMLVFGQDAQGDVRVDSSNIIASATLDNLALGPLHVTGLDGPKATSSVQIGPQKQVGSFKGKIVLYDFQVLLDLQFEFKPDPFFHFRFLLQFTPHLDFAVDANMIENMADIHDLARLDFKLVAVLQQDILDYIAQSINSQFEQATKAEKADIAEQQDKVDRAKKVVDDNVRAHRVKVDAAYAQWKAKSDVANAQFKATTDVYEARVKELQGQVDAATAKYKTDLANAQQQLSNANANGASRMQAAQAQVAQAQKDCTDRVAAARRTLDDATRDMNSRFGDAQHKIDVAQNNVNSIQNQINDMNSKISQLEHLTGIKAIGKAGLPALYTAKGTLLASMATAQGILTAAKAVLQSQNYLAAKGVMQAAQGALTAAQASGQAGIVTAQQTLATTDQSTQAAVHTASSALNQVGQVGPAAIAAASKTLDAYKVASIGTLNAAKAGVDTVAKGTEWVAYQSALAGLAAAQSSTHELDLANGALEVAKQGGAAVLKAADYIASHSLTFVDIHYIRFESEFGRAANGAEFAAEVQGSVAGQGFALEMTYDPRKTAAFITNTFQRLVDKLSVS
ncbi:FAD-binding PCMH-type domain-containing protein [Mycena indigotica]|uniref:FAD-binding PCMH-type domain-containing protein n=1 Tax=Mycena indigotica TaxID=2126181 RepID=A0A8H6W282_9AGAR|nr:FAD-binding PCMH-type domain-containing protein [Mycena indigotica]KAF7302282.1 FAD-binding PCMH-type domain-containing protein [Mycena indigotica]